jgi:hypothetical protein
MKQIFEVDISVHLTPHPIGDAVHDLRSVSVTIGRRDSN